DSSASPSLDHDPSAMAYISPGGKSSSPLLRVDSGGLLVVGEDGVSGVVSSWDGVVVVSVGLLGEDDAEGVSGSVSVRVSFGDVEVAAVSSSVVCDPGAECPLPGSLPDALPASPDDGASFDAGCFDVPAGEVSVADVEYGGAF